MQMIFQTLLVPESPHDRREIIGEGFDQNPSEAALRDAVTIG